MVKTEKNVFFASSGVRTRKSDQATPEPKPAHAHAHTHTRTIHMCTRTYTNIVLARMPKQLRVRNCCLTCAWHVTHCIQGDSAGACMTGNAYNSCDTFSAMASRTFEQNSAINELYQTLMQISFARARISTTTCWIQVVRYPEKQVRTHEIHTRTTRRTTFKTQHATHNTLNTTHNTQRTTHNKPHAHTPQVSPTHLPCGGGTAILLRRCIGHCERAVGYSFKLELLPEACWCKCSKVVATNHANNNPHQCLHNFSHQSHGMGIALRLVLAPRLSQGWLRLLVAGCVLL